MVCISARNLRWNYSHRLKILPGLAPYKLSSPRASVPLAFSSFPSALWNCAPFPPTYFFLRLEGHPSPGLLISDLLLCLILPPTLPKHQPEASSQGLFSLFQQGRLPRVEWGYFILWCCWRLPHSSSSFAFLQSWFFLHVWSALKTAFSTLSFGSTVSSTPQLTFESYMTYFSFPSDCSEFSISFFLTYFIPSYELFWTTSVPIHSWLFI